MAYPLIGNYGIAKEDFETKQPSIGGLAVRDYNDIPSNFRSAATLDEVRKAMRIDYFEDKELIEEQARHYARQAE